MYGRADQQGQPVVEQVNVGGSVGYVEHDPVTGQPLMLRTSNGIQTLYVSDGIGNPVGLLTDSATQSYAYKFDPYGAAVLTNGGGNGGTQQNPYLFKGGIQDRNTGWVHFGARWCDPLTGRWTQQDNLDNPLNPANAGDDPINDSDLSGTLTASQICHAQGLILSVLAILAVALSGLSLGGGIVGVIVAEIGIYALTEFACSSVRD